MLIRTLPAALCLAAAAVPAVADDPNLPPFDFSDQFYLANGINPATLIGRPNGTGEGSVIDNRENGPDFNNVRLLDTATAYDHSGHLIFFNVTGLPTSASFLNNAAGQHARQVADQYKVYEFPRAANPPFAVFPKRQDLIADLRNGYFSNDPLGIWQINLVDYTDAALHTPAGQQALADLAARNGRDLDGTPIIRTIDEVESLRSRGFVSISTPAADGSNGFRWFFCPVIDDPRDGAIAPDAFLTVTESDDAARFRALFACLQTTGDDHCDAGCAADRDHDGVVAPGDVSFFVSEWFAGVTGGTLSGDFDRNGVVQPADVSQFVGVWFNAVQNGGC